MGDPYKLKLFPGFTSRSIHSRDSIPSNSSSNFQLPPQQQIVYVNGVPVQVNGGEYVGAHSIPATYPPAGVMQVPTVRPPQIVKSLPPGSQVIFDPSIGQYRIVSSVPHYVDPPVNYQSPYGYNFDNEFIGEPIPPPSPNLWNKPQSSPLKRSQSFPPPQQYDQYQQQQIEQIEQQRQQQQQREQQQREQQRQQQQREQHRQQQQREQQQREQQQREQQQREQREQQQREQQQREQQQREQQQREKQQREQQQREQRQQQQQRELQQQREQQQREQQQRQQREQLQREQQQREQQQRKQQQREQQQREQQQKQQREQQQQTQRVSLPRKSLEPLENQIPLKQVEPQLPKERVSLPRKSLEPLEQSQPQIKKEVKTAKEYPIKAGVGTATTTTTTTAILKSNENDIRSRKRNNSVNELLSTEESYSDSLEKLILYYKLPLEELVNSEQKQQHHHSIGSSNKDKEENIITQSDVNSLFGNIEALLVISKDLLIKLKYEFSLPEDQQRIGDLYIEKTKEMKLYVAYINNYENAMATLKKIDTLQPKFFKECQSKYKYSLDIGSLLIMPVQRIPRYELLFREILKYTDKTNDGGIDNYNKLEEAQKSIHTINEYINNNKRLRENKDRVVTISNELKGCPSSLLKSSRRWIKEGILVTTCTHKKYNGQFMVYLFNDLIVLGKQHSGFRSKKMEYFAEINLENSEFKEIQGSPTKFRFISDPEGKNPLIFTFECESQKVKDTWISNLNLLEEERKISIINNK
ncbi:hypothetical protein ACTA71_000618 [Dictyostelium dimigraforme]